MTRILSVSPCLWFAGCVLFGSFSVWAQEPRAATPVTRDPLRLGISAGLGLDMLQRRPSGDDWILFSQSEYEYDGFQKLKRHTAAALTFAKSAKPPASGELAVDTDADARADAWVYFESGRPAVVELDVFNLGCHDVRVDVRDENFSMQRHRFWFLDPPIALPLTSGDLKLVGLFDWAATVAPRGPANEPLHAAAREIFASFAGDAAALAKTTPDAAHAKRLVSAAEQAKLLLPGFANIHRDEGLAKKLKIHQGSRTEYRPYDLDGKPGREISVGYAPWGVECIRFFKRDWLEGVVAEKGPRVRPPGLIAEVSFRGETVSRVELEGRRYFPLGGHWLRVSTDARQGVAKDLLVPAFADYRAGRWYAAIARWKVAVTAAALLGDYQVTERGQIVGSLREEEGADWGFEAGGFQAADLMEFGHALISRTEMPSVFEFARSRADAGDEGAALEFYALSLRIADKGHKTLRKVLALERMSELYHRLGQYDRAIECLFQSLDLEGSLGYSADVIENLRVLAQQPDDLEIMQRTMQIRTHAIAVNRCAKLGRIAAHYVELGEFERAKNYLSEAERLSPPLSHKYLEADLLCLRAKLELAEDRTELAIDRLRRAYVLVERQAADQQSNEHGAELYRRGQSAHSFTLFGMESRYVLTMRAGTHPLAYQSLIAGLLTEALLQQSAEKPPSEVKLAGKLLDEAKDWQEKALACSQTAKDKEGILAGELRLAALAALQGKRAEALAAAEQIVVRSRAERRFETLWRGLALVATLRQAQGDTVGAIAAFESAAQEIESLRARLQSEPVRRGFFGSKVDVYEELAQLYLTAAKSGDAPAGSAEQVWLCMERAKARSLLDTVGGAPLRLKGDAVTEAAQHAPQLWQTLAARSGDGEHEPDLLEGLADRPRLQEVASFASVQPAGLAALAKVLGERDLLVEYFSTRDELLAATVWQGRVEVLRLADLPAETVRTEVESFRREIDNPRGVYEPVARRLFDRLLAPCLKGKSKVERICIVPGGSLHYLPFAALMLPSGEFLIERCPVFTAPSASALVYAHHRRQPGESTPGSGALVAADPIPPLGFSALPYAAREGREVHGLTRDSPPLLLGKGATETAVLAALADSRSFHFAGHTHLPASSPLRAALLCTEDLDHDGRLEAREILDLNLRHCELAVLSACETRLGRYSRGDEIVGLERAFLRAGVPTVVASLWKVDDAATQALMVEFYGNLWTKKQGKLESLRGAQLALLDGRLKPRVDEAVRALGLPEPLPDGGAKKPSLRHPRYWAAFVLSGDWR